MNITKKAYVLDLETTGLKPNENEIIEIGVTEIINGQIGKSFNRLIKPKKTIPTFITNLTGITNEMVVDSKSIEEVLPNLRKLLGDNLIICHNVSFDKKFLNYNLVKLGLPKIENTFCTLETLRNFKGYKGENHKLETACKYFRIKNDNAHRASSDTKATAELFLILTNQII